MKRKNLREESIKTKRQKKLKNSKTVFLEGTQGDSLLKDFKLSEIKTICKKQKGCEDCQFAINKSVGGVCQFSPIGTTPEDWKIASSENEVKI